MLKASLIAHLAVLLTLGRGGPPTEPEWYPSPPATACGPVLIKARAPGSGVEASLILSAPECSELPLRVEAQAAIYNPMTGCTTYLFSVDLCQFCPDAKLTAFVAVYYAGGTQTTPDASIFNDGSCCGE